MINSEKRSSTTTISNPQPLSAADFKAWQALIERHIGVVIASQSRVFLQLALEARMRVLGISDQAHYYQRLSNVANSRFEWSQLLANLTVQETSFFRHPPVFDFLTNYLQGRLADIGKRPLMLWSAGCSSGEEAYSLAITAFEALHGTEAHFGVLAGDISETALAKARTGRYNAKRVTNIPPRLLERYFEFEPLQNSYKVNAKLAAKVCFTRLNLLALGQEPFVNLDVIVCQNLLIYFRRPKRFEILNQLATRLSEGGLLLIGSGEAALWQHPELVAVANGAAQAFVRKKSCAE